MRLEKKHLGILFILLSVIILIFFVYFLFFYNQESILKNNEKNSGSSGFPNENNSISKVENKKPLRVINNEIDLNEIILNKEDETESNLDKLQIKNEDELIRIAASFAERYGSYSNQSNFNNVNDLKIFMTAKMSDWSEKYIIEKKKENSNNQIYYGITSKSISEEILQYDEEKGFAKIQIGTRRREAIGTTDHTSKVFAQNIIIDFKKENDIWKVDGAFWK